MWSRIWTVLVSISSKVWGYILPVIQLLIKAERQNFIDVVSRFVKEAEAQYPGTGTGQQKYEWVVANLKKSLGELYNSQKGLFWDTLIHAALARLQTQPGQS